MKSARRDDEPNNTMEAVGSRQPAIIDAGLREERHALKERNDVTCRGKLLYEPKRYLMISTVL